MAAPEFYDCLDAVPVVEMIVDQEPIRHQWTFLDNGKRRLQIWRLEDFTAPASQERFHAVEHRRFVVDSKRRDADELARINAGILARRQFDRRRVRPWYGDHETRPAAGFRFKPDRAIEYPRQPLHDG